MIATHISSCNSHPWKLDPGPGATIGGMMSSGCSGTNAVRYGTANGEWFLNATVVLPSGEVIKTRQSARKSAAGFDATKFKLFIGAEGTLGIITEVTLLLVTIRRAPVLPTTVAIVYFPDVKRATEAVIDVINGSVGICRLSLPHQAARSPQDPECVELCDSEFMRSINLCGASQRKYPEQGSLFFKFQRPTSASIAETARIVKEIVQKHGGTDYQLARTEKEVLDL
ncbi:uncharacterized protein F5891DRAFT_1211130 [Suillus fuscotomentosus]|uniref:FAD-binding PCMH-type domain-containing protein n=1 Tax=Suillus fuscotomentosus TaxID=1912939 RepID=A0AAD4DRF4_9AGAM|nr:uncharacterized protein F5891DRAFT_1211130 [Suillus fuscotomentosus]KAG1891666.1 hypothetical protein F5891DRAFT_1211130 [Suillus fuscotomentosus]